MKFVPNVLSAALFAAVSCIAVGAFAAAPVDLDPGASPPVQYKLDTVLVVHNWILCVSQPGAERLARARAESLAEAEKAYAELSAQKACGRFKKLGVLLKEPLYRSGPGAAHDARVFAAQVNIGVGWQNAFVVSGDPPQE